MDILDNPPKVPQCDPILRPYPLRHCYLGCMRHANTRDHVRIQNFDKDQFENLAVRYAMGHHPVCPATVNVAAI